MVQAKRGTKPNFMKTSNRKLVLDMIRMHPFSRIEISRLTQLSRATVTIIVDELISQGLVRETESAPSCVSGRHPIQLCIVEDAKYILSVCVMRRGIRAGIVNLGGAVLCECLLSNPCGPEEAADFIRRQLEVWMIQYRFPKEKLLGIGIMAPGPLKHMEGQLLNPFGLPEWHNVPIVSLFSNALSLPAVLERDTNALVLEEKYFGKAGELENFMVLQSDVAVGSGVIIHNRLYRGASGLGSEIGHVSINFAGPPCKCGNRGCLERYVAIPEILRDTPYRRWEDVVMAVEAGDDAARQVMERTARYLSIGIINAFNLFDLERVFLLGDLGVRADQLLEMLNGQVRQGMIMHENFKGLPVACSDITYNVRTGAMPMLHTFYH